jgi:hypothetical protein
MQRRRKKRIFAVFVLALGVRGSEAPRRLKFCRDGNGLRMDFCYLKQPPKRYTFEQPLLKQWVEEYSQGKVLNLFAGKTRLNLNEVRNDANPEMPAEYHKDAYVFVTEWVSGFFDTIILDPPYNLRKSREKYHGRFIGPLTKLKNKLPGILRIGGRVISLGYDSVGMGECRGFKKLALCVVCHGGDHNDTLCLVEEKIGGRLFDNGL